MEAIQQMAAVAGVACSAPPCRVLRRRGIAGVSLSGKALGRRIHCLERLSLSPRHASLGAVGDNELLLASSPPDVLWWKVSAGQRVDGEVGAYYVPCHDAPAMGAASEPFSLSHSSR
jgi:hypothetical protein